jgi:hypothetical protein
VAWLELQGKWKDQLNAIVDFLEDFHVDTVVADATAVGDPLTELLQDLLPSVQVVPYVFSVKGNDQLYRYYLNELESGRISYPAGEQTQQTPEYQQFIFQHVALAKTYRGQFMTCHAPEGEHDDYCDSAALACLAATYEALADVEDMANPLYTGGSFNNCYSRADRYR